MFAPNPSQQPPLPKVCLAGTDLESWGAEGVLEGEGDEMRMEECSEAGT